MSHQEVNNETMERKDFQILEVGYAIPETNGFSRNHFGTKEIVKEIRMKRKNIGLYRTSFWYREKDPYSKGLFSDFYMDFDSEEDIEKAREDLLFVIWKLHLEAGFGLPMDAFRIYFSGKKGFHLVIPWQYMNIEPRDDLDSIFRWIGEDLFEQSINQTIDLVVYERRRLFRLEHSIHQDTGLYKIPLHYEEAANMSIEDIQSLAKKNRIIKYPMPHIVVSAQNEYRRYIKEYEEFLKMKRTQRPKGLSIKKGETPDVIQELIDQGPIRGIRNETAAALTSFWKNQGYEPDEIFELLLEWNQGSQSEKELRTTMNSILKRDLNYGLNRFKSLLEGEIGKSNNRKEYNEMKKGRLGR